MKIQNTKVFGLDDSIRRSKYPKSVKFEDCTCEITDTSRRLGNAKAGSGHDNYLKGIIVQFDMTYSIKMSVELERYHFIDFVSSQSTMHKITKMDVDQNCNCYVDKRVIDVVNEKITKYNSLDDTNTDSAKELYLEILYNVPTGFELTAGFTTNYLQLKTIYYQRKNHRLPEWGKFCEWCENLPKFNELVLGQ